jgi:hypothetical protein
VKPVGEIPRPDAERHARRDTGGDQAVPPRGRYRRRGRGHLDELETKAGRRAEGVENQGIVRARARRPHEPQQDGEPESRHDRLHWIRIVAATDGTPDVSTMNSM